MSPDGRQYAIAVMLAGHAVEFAADVRYWRHYCHRQYVG